MKTMAVLDGDGEMSVAELIQARVARRELEVVLKLVNRMYFRLLSERQLEAAADVLRTFRCLGSD